MAYPYQNNYPYPVPDRLAQLQYQQMPMNQGVGQIPTQQGNGILWVSGEIGAKSYLVAPGTTVLLMDSEAQKFYIKTSDIAGMPMIRTFEYSEVHPNAQKDISEPSENLDARFVTRQEYNEMRAQYEAVMQKLNSISVEEPKKRKAVTEHE